MAEEPLKSAAEWLLEYSKLVILDPDGWDRDPDKWEASWGERIDKTEFLRRVNMCTIQFSPDMMIKADAT